MLEAPAAEPAVTVSFANYNGRALVGELLDSLAAQDYPIAEIIMVDDGSTDESVAFVREHYPHVRIIELGRNTVNINLVWNTGIAASKTRYVLSMDNDMTLAPNALRTLMDALRSLPNAAIVTPRILDYDHPDTISQEAPRMHYVCFAEQTDRDKTVAEATTVPDRRAGCGQQLLDTEIIRPFGFHNENLAFGWNDVELPWRMNLAGYVAYNIPDARFFNRRVRSEPRYYGQIMVRWYIMLEVYALRTLLLISPALLVFECAYFGYIVSKGAVRDYLRSVRYMAGHWGEVMAARRRIQATRRTPDRELMSAGDLLIPFSVNAGRVLRMAVSLMNQSLRVYWTIVRPLL